MARKRKPEDIERGGRLKRARLAAGYETGAEAADQVELEYSTYNNHESGWRKISWEQAREYAKHFDVNHDWLYSNIGQMRGRTTNAPLDLLAGLPSSARQEAIDFINFLKAKHGV